MNEIVAQFVPEFKYEDIVFDECANCGSSDKLIRFVAKDDPENAIDETCYNEMNKRTRDEFIPVASVPSGKPSASQRLDEMIFGEDVSEGEDDE